MRGGGQVKIYPYKNGVGGQGSKRGISHAKGEGAH